MMARPVTASPAGRRSLRVCVVGDSIAAGTGDAQSLGWHGRVARSTGHPDLTIYGLGVRGDTSVDVERRWRAEVDARMPAVFPSALVFQFGLNDCAVRTWADGRTERREAIETTVEATGRVLAAARRRARTLFVGPAPVDDGRPGPQLLDGVSQRLSNADIREVDARLCAVAAHVHVPYLAVFDALVADERWELATRSGDGVHPSAEGYDVLAELIMAWGPWHSIVRVCA